MTQFKDKLLVTLFLFFSISAFGAGTFIKGPALIEGMTVVTSAAGTTTLTKNSETNQVLTGSSAQTFKLPDATTIPLGRKFFIINKSTGTATVNDNSGTLVASVLSGQQKSFYLRTAGSAAGTWDATRIIVDLTNDVTGTLGVASGGTGGNSFTANSVLLGNGTSAFQTVAGSVSGDVLSYNGSSWVSKTISTGGGSGTVTGPASSVSGEATIFNGTSGTSLGRATGTGFAKLTSGVLSAQTSVSLSSDITGTLGILNGGTGQTTANAALNALLPAQTSNSGKYLTTDGTNSSWATVSVSGSGSGDVTGPASSVSGEVTVFNDTTGKKVARATGTGFAKLTSGVLSAQTSVSMTSDISLGTLDVAGGVLVTDGSGFLQNVGLGTSGNVLKSNGNVSIPSWGSATPLSTKGDVLTWSTSIQRKGVGGDGTVLTADSSQATGLSWKYPESAFVQKSGSYTAVSSDTSIAYTSDGTLALPAAASFTGKIYHVFTTGTTVATIDPNSAELICNHTTIKLTGDTAWPDGGDFVSDGSNWQGLGQSCTRTCVAQITNGGSAAIGSQRGNCLSSVSTSSTGVVVVNFQSGMFSAAPFCTAQTTSTYQVTRMDTASTSSVTVNSRNLSNTLTNTDFEITCIGPR